MRGMYAGMCAETGWELLSYEKHFLKTEVIDLLCTRVSVDPWVLSLTPETPQDKEV